MDGSRKSRHAQNDKFQDMSFHNALTIIIAMSFLGISLVLCFIAIRGAVLENKRVERRLAGGATLDKDSDIGIGARSNAKRNLMSQLGSPHLTRCQRNNAVTIFTRASGIF